jgi:hypothetical protein
VTKKLIVFGPGSMPAQETSAKAAQLTMVMREMRVFICFLLLKGRSTGYPAVNSQVAGINPEGAHPPAQRHRSRASWWRVMSDG